MKIITASKFYYTRGGLEAYLFKITELLKSNNHEVIPFSTNYMENIKTEYDDFFAEYLGLGGAEKLSVLKKMEYLFRIIYNFEAASKFSKLLDHTQPDIVWGFGIHKHLSPSIFVEAQKRSIPVVHRLSDYGIICPDSRLIRGDGENCPDLLCPLNGYHNAVKYKCVRQIKSKERDREPALAASVVGALELYLHNKFKLYINNVNKFIAPSNFLGNTMIKGGIPEEKIQHIPIFIDPNKFIPSFESQNYLLYFGRLTEEKGLTLLLEAMKEYKQYKLVIVGSGPQELYLKNIKAEQNIENVEFVGKKFGDELHEIIRKSRFVVVPSIWYDNSPNVILEAYALGKPVLGAKIGGIPEYIEEDSTGLLYEYNNVEELKDKIRILMDNSQKCVEMGKNARHLTETTYSPQTHYEQVYSLLCSLTNS